MNTKIEPISTIAFAGVLLGWLAFVFIFIVRKKPASAPARKRDRTSIAGLALQGASFALVWAMPRRTFALIQSSGAAGRVALAVIVLALVACAIWITNAAVRSLGKEWSLTARIVDEHRLVTVGPYRLVRHPIYTGMLCMLLATGLSFSRPIALLLAVLVFLVGTIIRVRSEEKLLREAFGAEYDAYRRRVPAILPFVI